MFLSMNANGQVTRRAGLDGVSMSGCEKQTNTYNNGKLSTSDLTGNASYGLGIYIFIMAKYRPEFGHKSQSSAWNGISNWLSLNRINGDVDSHIENFLKSKNVEISKDKSINANRVQNRFNEFKKFIK